MNYSIDISAHDAALFIGQEPDETEAEFTERAERAKGKHFIAFRVVDKRPDGKQKAFTMHSPYFELADDEQRDAIIKATFEAIGKAVIAGEELKAKEPAPKEKSKLVLPPGFGLS